MTIAAIISQSVGGGYVPPGDAPVADFIVSTLTPNQGDTIMFTDTSTNAPTAWAWYIDGALFSNEQNPIYYCSSQGFPVFTLTASNAFGSDSHSQGVSIGPPIGV